DMLDEEFKELAHIFLNPDIQLIETIEYFTKYPEKLTDRAYQTLLHMLLFEQGVLDKHLAIEGFDTQLAQFIKINYEHYKKENKVQTMVFLLKVAHQLQGFCPKQSFFQKTDTELHLLLKCKGIEPEAKHLIYTAFIAQLGHKENLSDEEMAYLLAGS